MSRYKVAIGFLAAAAFGVVLFYVGLHPASGALGGIVHLLLGWLLPSLVVFALALGLAWLVPAPWPARIALALVLSCVLGLNTALMKISRVFAYAPAIKHIDLNLFKHADTYYAVIDVYDRGTKIASFRHDGLPPEAFEERAGVGRGKFAVNFWANATDLLLHDNVWTRLLGRIAPSYFPESELQAFFWKVAGSG